jgi:hypothetical protein
MKKHSWIISLLFYLVTAYVMSFIGKEERGSNDYVFGLIASLGVLFAPWIGRKIDNRKSNKV